ncbi:hypothetical protein O181_092756 [Austropuccinia psidii MF-1]|uniref:Uncharacterized protein n=1 Tax=Austropuccinia psidii MF-1 TaxID=1389203 RepID=A0A9Q3PAX5_9BASI|nr:hypothetical protein [Austropuccinia psidii MF-1]
MVQRTQGKGTGNLSKPFAWGHELLLAHQELSGSVEDHRTLTRMEFHVLQRQGKEDKSLVGEPKSFVHRPKEGIANEPSFGERRTSSVNQLQNSPKPSPKDLRRKIELSRTIKER